MTENNDEMLERLTAMAVDGQQTWDLNERDQAAIGWAARVVTAALMVDWTPFLAAPALVELGADLTSLLASLEENPSRTDRAVKALTVLVDALENTVVCSLETLPIVEGKEVRHGQLRASQEGSTTSS